MRERTAECKTTIMHSRLKDENHSSEKSAYGRKTAKSDLSLAPGSNSYYGSTSLQDESVPEFYIPWCGVVFYVMASFGLFSANLLRSGLNVAIVAMVNQTAVADMDVGMSNVTEDQCPTDPELQYEGGELNWDRNQQGIVLAAFYYGYGFTQVNTRNIKVRKGPSSFLNICEVDHALGLYKVVPTFLKSSFPDYDAFGCRILQFTA